MIHASVVMRRGLLVPFLLFSLVSACGGSQKKAKHDDEKLVPEETQQRARERQGKQQLMWDQMGMTTSEQAAAQHDNATKPVENPKYGKDKDDSEE